MSILGFQMSIQMYILTRSSIFLLYNKYLHSSSSSPVYVNLSNFSSMRRLEDLDIFVSFWIIRVTLHTRVDCRVVGFFMLFSARCRSRANLLPSKQPDAFWSIQFIIFDWLERWLRFVDVCSYRCGEFRTKNPINVSGHVPPFSCTLLIILLSWLAE